MSIIHIWGGSIQVWTKDLKVERKKRIHSQECEDCLTTGVRRKKKSQRYTTRIEDRWPNCYHKLKRRYQEKYLRLKPMNWFLTYCLEWHKSSSRSQHGWQVGYKVPMTTRTLRMGDTRKSITLIKFPLQVIKLCAKTSLNKANFKYTYHFRVVFFFRVLLISAVFTLMF